LLGESIPGGLDTESIQRWAEELPVLPRRGSLIVHALTLLLAVAALSWVALDAGRTAFLAILVLQVVFVLVLARSVRKVLGSVERRAAEWLERASVRAALEREAFTAPHPH